jgi:hypothetical protein
MKRNIQGALLLAAGAFLFHPIPGRAQGAPATSASQPDAGPAMPTSVSDEDINLLRRDVRSSRKDVLTANLRLNSAEAEKFWPLYEEYANEASKINDRLWAMMKTAASNANITEEQAKGYVKESAAVDADLIALRSKYLPRFAEVLPGKKVVQFYQLDRRMDLLLNLQLASVVPLIDPTK